MPDLALRSKLIIFISDEVQLVIAIVLTVPALRVKTSVVILTN